MELARRQGARGRAAPRVRKPDRQRRLVSARGRSLAESRGPAPAIDAGVTADRTLRLRLAYDGTAYAGWQVQPDAVTVQGLLLAAARRLLGPDTRVVGASRTDAGVHALGQVASLTTASELRVSAVLGALNAELPADIRILAVSDAPAGFHARRHARAKRYAYLIDNGAVASPLLRRYAWHVPVSLDVGAMRAGLALLRGRQDFSAFRAAAGRSQRPVCHLTAVHVVQRRSRLAIVLSADRYLHHMVRNIVGSAVAIGRGTHDPAWMGDVLAGRDRTKAGATAPAQGLTLVSVLY
ncbi:MAG: tRNA pseudouridine(38-40) synthase TruA [Candidatus Rokuibacteriota bacterium]|nr:MAG: tRNA pseudouridine(38-40) synthase TruA [Candidatus Rokubacteria bacterium]